MDTPTHTITLRGKSHPLHYSSAAKFRFQASGGKISKLFDADESYMHSIILIWTGLPADTRREHYPEPITLCADVPEEAHDVYEAAFTAAHAAGWFPTAEELQQRLVEANKLLDQAEQAKE